MEGRAALVTGGNSGIGRATALALGRAGADVAVNYVARPEEALAVCREIRCMGRRALPVEADISDPNQARAMVERTVAEFGRLDILVNNAGLQIEKPFLDLTLADWDKMLSVDLRGTFLVTLHAAREMAKRKFGRIVNVTSVHQEIAKPRFAPYCAAKAGVGMLTKVLALELAPHRINVNAVAPGAIATPMNRDVLENPEKLARVRAQIPWGRLGTPEEVAALVVYLASDAADYVTGATFTIDGGLTEQVVEY
ncbi:MAG: SDR family oxidoreductase [Armatimonadota bacterium]